MIHSANCYKKGIDMIKKNILSFFVFLLVIASLGCINKDSDDDGYSDDTDAFPKTITIISIPMVMDVQMKLMLSLMM